jgi:hypothetical protein
MASPYQQQAFQRKLIYLFSIIALFTGAWLWRHHVVEAQAAPLGMLESSRGDVDLSGKFLQLSLTGMRGLVTSTLWMTATDNQRKNQWNQVDQNVRTLTKLQPHFIRPWIFQAWNLSYNVSVSLDRTSDKYFYIARGQELLAEGERQNRDNPEIRWTIGFTYQHKITMHDETNVLRSLLQLSMIPPNERDPARFLKTEGDTSAINWAEFEDFCKEHPQLVRRLHSGIQRDTRRETQRQFRCATANAVVQFLKDNYKVVSIYETPPPAAPNLWVRKDDRLLDETERFPVLPPAPGKEGRATNYIDPNAINSDTTLNDGHDSYALARAWFAYSMDPVPPPGDLPGENTQPTDRLRQRVPKNMMTSIFRQTGPRAASYMADRMEQEGWFDAGPWPIPDWFKERNNRFGDPKSSDPKDSSPAQVELKGPPLARDLWDQAFKLWHDHGVANHLLFDNEAELQNKKDDAAAFAKRHHLDSGSMPPNLRPEDLSEEERREFEAFRFMYAYGVHIRVTNILHHYHRAKFERLPEVVEARKLFYEADTKRISASPHEALERYLRPQAIPAFVKLVTLPENADVLADTLIQEELAEIEMKYLDLLNEEIKPAFQRSFQAGWGLPLAVRFQPDHFPGRIILTSPFVDDKGKSIITQQARDTTEQRRAKPGARQAQPPGEAPPPGPGGPAGPVPAGPGGPQ